MMRAASRVLESATGPPAFTAVIAAADLEASTARNVPEALAILAGIHISDVTGAGRFYRVEMRGFGAGTPQDILMLIDGRPANLSDGRGPDWSLIPLERIARIEIARGSRGNVLYGDHAVAGVINIVTKTGGPLSGGISAAYGSYDTGRATAAVRQAGEKWSYEIAAGYLESDGYRDNGDRSEKDIGGGFEFGGGPGRRFFFTAGYHEDDTGSPGALPAADLDAGRDRRDAQTPLDYDDVEDWQAQSGLELPILSNDLFKLEASYRDRSARRFQAADPLVLNGGFSDTLIDTDSYGIAPQLVFQEDFEGVANRLILGYDFLQLDRRVGIREAAAGFSADNERRSNSFYVHDELSVGPHWALSGGYRWQRAHYEFGQAPVGERSLTEKSWNAALAYHFGADARIYGSFTKGFRFPVLDEIYAVRRAVVNTDLHAQTFDNYEIGLHSQLTRWLNLSINVFRIETEDEILQDPAGPGYVNLDDETRRQGLELVLDSHWKGLRFGGGYTYMEATFEAGPFKDNQIPDVPEDHAFAHIGYASAGGLFMGLEGIYAGGRHLAGDLANAAAKLDDYLVINARLRYAWRWVTLYADFNNIFDQRYAAYGVLSDAGIAGYYPAPEFNFLAGIRFDFGKKI